MTHRLVPWLALAAMLQLAGCGERAPPADESGAKPAVAGAPALDRLARADFNRRAAEHFLPVFWRSDADNDKALDPDELVTLWGVAGGGQRADFVDADGAFTDAFLAAYQRLIARDDLSRLPQPEQRRRKAVLEELAQGRPTLIETDLTAATPGERAMVGHVLAAAAIIERVYARQMGVFEVRDQVPADDPASRMLMYRNQGPFCQAPKTEADPACSALATRPGKISGLYPAAIQNGTDTRFCALLEARPDAADLLEPFTVVLPRAGGKAAGDAATDELEAVPYNVAYRADMEEISSHLMAASAAIDDPAMGPLALYLAAAAESFLSNDWEPADEAWAQMNSGNSKWYLRIGPDETYDEPCSHKALFHVSFARINPDGLEWRRRLEPHKNALEAELAALAGPPYAARAVTFQLPDFIDIVLNAADSRAPLGATIGQALPNWGPVANEGRGRTVAMVNLYTDPDSAAAWRETNAALFCRATMERAAFEPKLGVMSTVLHEAAHHLGPAHEYEVEGRTAAEIFGGATASMLEELKAQTAALYFTDWLAAQDVIERDAAERAHLGDVAWAFGHIAQGMYDAERKPKPYSQLAAIQMGSLHRAGVVAWREKDKAANGRDTGCFSVDLARWPEATRQLAARVLRIKGSGDRAGADALRAEFVDAADDWARLRDVIRERVLRAPKASFVYAIRE